MGDGNKKKSLIKVLFGGHSVLGLSYHNALVLDSRKKIKRKKITCLNLNLASTNYAKLVFRSLYYIKFKIKTFIIHLINYFIKFYDF